MKQTTPTPSIQLPALKQTNISWSLNEIVPGDSSGVIPARCHDYYEIFIHIFGDVSLEADGRLYLLSPGDTAILPPYTLHRLVNPRTQTARYYSLRIPETYDSDFFACLHQPASKLYLSPTIKDARRLAALCPTLDTLCEPNVPSTAKRLTTVAALISLIEEIQLGMHLLAPTPLSPELQAAIGYMESAHAQALTVAGIAQHAGVTPSALTQLFRNEFDTTPFAYLLELRLRKARELINTDLSLNEICNACGFTDYSRFIERFRKTYGITPHKLRRFYSRAYH